MVGQGASYVVTSRVDPDPDRLSLRNTDGQQKSLVKDGLAGVALETRADPFGLDRRCSGPSSLWTSSCFQEDSTRLGFDHLRCRA